ncbi:type VII secretion integral membrane protein EccD [Saccharomonospora sp. NPDC046836]|uniref:type VII secretion integral membrane protein EccD n=1 Tax=Saccharomonospora sp. NPDC046836 TaxID=3156921 RepID=UPI0033EB0A32
MTAVLSIALAKVTIVAPKRSIDVALPENVVVAELLPYLLRHAGEEVPDEGERHGGWALRRPTGDTVDSRQTLAAQRVLDGEVLYLVPGRVEWPELEYDDLVEAIASGARRYGRSWDRAATRLAGLAICAAVLVSGTVVTLLFRPPWSGPGLIMLAAAFVLAAIGVIVARTVPDAQAGAVFAGSSLPYAFLGGYLLTGPQHAGLLALGGPQLMLGATSLVVFGLLGYVGVGGFGRVFVAAVHVGLLGLLGGLFAAAMDPDAAASLVLTVGIALLPVYPLLAARSGRLPLPALPQRPAELLEDTPSPPTSSVFAAAVRTDEILSGLLLGLSIVSVVCGVYLAAHGGVSRLIMLACVAFALLLRARLFPVPRQRIPLLVAGILAVTVLATSLAAAVSGNGGLVGVLLLVGLVAVGAAAVGMTYSRTNPSPYLGRVADIVDVLVILALIPFTCYITGFFGYVQGLMASIG